MGDQEIDQERSTMNASVMRMNANAAEAATVSPSLRNLLRSVVAGGAVLLVLGAALSPSPSSTGPRGSSDRSHESTDLAACLRGRARGANPERACARGAGGLRNSF